MVLEKGLYFIMFYLISRIDFKEKGRIECKLTSREGFEMNSKVFCWEGKQNVLLFLLAFELQIFQQLLIFCKNLPHTGKAYKYYLFIYLFILFALQKPHLALKLHKTLFFFFCILHACNSSLIIYMCRANGCRKHQSQ